MKFVHIYVYQSKCRGEVVRLYAMKAYGGVIPLILIHGCMNVSRQLHYPDALLLCEKPRGVHRTEHWVVPRARLDAGSCGERKNTCSFREANSTACYSITSLPELPRLTQ
jgi:hypothetical protein